MTGGTRRIDDVDEPLLSVVLPVHDESETLDELHRRLAAAVSALGPHELVFVDDGSRDDSWTRLLEIAARDDSVRLVRLSRNFGHQIAITAGVDAARGDAVVLMDADLQDPPELIPDLVARWQQGYDVVYAVRQERTGDSRFKRGTASAFYKLLNRLSGTSMPEQAGDFRLLSSRAADALRAMPERARYLRGMTSWIGFRQTGVPYRREPRYAGETKYPLRRMLRFATDAVTSFSSMPVRAVSALGLAVVAFCVVYLLYTLYKALFTHDTVEGWASVIVLVLLLGGVQLLSLGMIGQYVARIFDEVKRRPLYVVDELVERAPDGVDTRSARRGSE